MRNKIFLLLFLTAIIIPERVAPATTTTLSPEITDRTGVAVVVVVTTAVLTFVLAMSIFGHRMRYSGIRWFTINLCLWGLVHMAYVSAYCDRAPWPEWFQSKMWREKRTSIETLGRTVFPYGVIFLILERMIITYAPYLEDNWIFNLFFAAIFLFGHNSFLITIFAVEYSYPEGMCIANDDNLINPNCYWYSPVELWGIYFYVIYTFFIEIFVFFMLFSFCCCCYSMSHYETSKKKPSTFTDVYFTFWFAQIPMIYYMPSFGFAVMQLLTQRFMDWIIEQGLLQLIMGGGGGMDMSSEWMQIGMKMMRYFLEAMPWFIILFPLAEVVMVLLIFRMYREQLFYILSFGHLFAGKPEKYSKSRIPIEQTGRFANPNTTVVLIPVPNGNGKMMIAPPPHPQPTQPEKLPVATPPGK